MYEFEHVRAKGEYREAGPRAPHVSKATCGRGLQGEPFRTPSKTGFLFSVVKNVVNLFTALHTAPTVPQPLLSLAL